MCVLFGPEVVLKNAFAAKRDTKSYIELDALREFCDILYHKVTKQHLGTNGYKYVYFQLDKDDLEDFCESNQQFVNGINRIYTTRAVDENVYTRINNTYTKDIRKSLEEARV